MKKLLVAVVALGLAGPAAASTLDLSFGTNFLKSSAVDDGVLNGRCMSVCWHLDSDIALGFYNEGVNYDDGGEHLSVNALQVTKGVLKNVAVGLNLGTAEATDGDDGPLVDILGKVKMLSGSGDKVEGSVEATVAARFSNAEWTGNEDWVEGVNAILAITIGF